MIARMQIRETAWDALLAGAKPSSFKDIFRNGQWKQIHDAQNPAGFILIDVIGQESEIDALYNHFAPGDRQSIWKWGFDGKVDFDTEYAGQHNDILATQPAESSFGSPIWTHGWLGQGKNRFARSVTRGFGRGFA